MKILKKLFLDESGSPALEYALILGLVGVAIFAAMQSLSTSTGSLMDTLVDEVEDMTGRIGGN